MPDEHLDVDISLEPAPAPSAAPGPEKAAPEPCLNCGADRVGAYCHACGQHFLDQRLTLRWLIKEFVARFFKLERGFLYTFRKLFTDPGGVARRYVEGQRRQYFNPLTYFILSAAISLLVMALYEQQVVETLNTMDNPIVESLGGTESNQEELRALMDPTTVINTLKQTYTIMMMLVCIPFALLLRFFFGGQGRRYNLAETFIFVLYTTGHVILIAGLLAPFAMMISIWASQAVTFLAYFVICGYAALGFYGRRFQSVLLTIIAILGAWMAFLIAAGIAGFIYGFVTALQSAG